MNRSKKGFLNVFSNLLNQAVAAICGFIVPKLVLEAFGSNINGMVSSVSSFLGVIALMESGFGSVAKTAFYKPLAEGDSTGVSGVYNATESFFRKIALLFGGYCIVLSLIFPFIKESGFDYFFTMTLVLILGINSFMQYYFGVSYTVLFNADQRGYVSGFLQVATVILNAVLTVIMLNLGAGIHMVKLVSAGVFIIKPIVINIYGRKRYKTDRRIPADKNSLSQKWDNFGQSIALYVHTKTDSVLITLFLNYSEVSVYSVYSLVTTSLSTIITAVSSGFVAALGNMYAGNEKENFKKIFSLYEFVNTTVSFVFYTIAFVLIIPFVKVYTANIIDVDYIRPLFGGIIIISELLYCLRLPYYYMITNARHFKQIKKGAYIEAALNVVLSLILINFWGITGLAAGTAVAMLFRTVQIAVYCSKNIINRSFFMVIKRFAVNLVAAVCTVALSKFFAFGIDNFIELFVYAVIIGIIALIVFCAVNFVFYREDIKILFSKIRNIIRR
ncbi:MAG: polysaccharide biosynthesis C-terminal domain-containing protein [Clostridia bacterium]|nr:polysaccharide biosynthesis C-terminal domain-containing protein [Clostridia bacterium]